MEHQPFSFITGNWRGRPLTSYQVIVELVAPRPRRPAYGFWLNDGIPTGTTS